MTYKDTLKKLYEAEDMDYQEATDISDEVVDEPVEEIEDEVVEEGNEDITVASMVTVVDASSYTAEDLTDKTGAAEPFTDENLEDFITKVENKEVAVVFDEDNDNPNMVDIVYEDGLEVFNIIKSNLELAEDDVLDTSIPLDDEDEELPEEEEELDLEKE